MSAGTKLKNINVLKMSAAEARLFFYKGESYCSIDLPFYFDFSSLIETVANKMSGKTFSELELGKPADFENVNYKLLSNKDGKYSWRPFELINPILYVSLVNIITRDENWKLIQGSFKQFQSNKEIDCKSIPLESQTYSKDKAAQIRNWWSEIEQESISLSIDYDFLLHTDITNFYPSIYSHSIPWALHTKAVAKERAFRNDKNKLGNQIDFHLQAMSYGQTNGIPQGSVLMDFISEILLGSVDQELSIRLKKEKISDLRILRYRDDYRIFVNNQTDGLKVLKIITELLSDYGLKLNSSKTSVSDNVVKDSLKADKLFSLAQPRNGKNIQKRLLQIHALSEEFPDSGSLHTELKIFFDKISKRNLSYTNLNVLISIIVDIMYKSPKVMPLASAVLSRLVDALPNDEMKADKIAKVQRKFLKIPNTGLLQVWLQRISLGVDSSVVYSEGLCAVVYGGPLKLWNTDWITKAPFKKLLQSEFVLNERTLETMDPVIDVSEVDLFNY